jgi:hypothetical protein
MQILDIEKSHRPPWHGKMLAGAQHKLSRRITDMRVLHIGG